MKSLIVLTLVSIVGAAVPAHAQLGSLGDRLKQAQGAKDKFDKKIAEIKISDADERKLGEEVSAKLRQEFGVYQDKDVTRYVSLVGTSAGAVELTASVGLAVHRARHRRCERLCVAGRDRSRHARAARPGQERSGAGRRARSRNHSRDREAHGPRD